jgi:very-short-patch-repair endonuclease
MTLNWLDVAAGQAGAISTAQLAAAGLSRAAVRGLSRSGVLEGAGRGVYVVKGRPRTWLGALWLGVLETGTDSFVCRRSAAAMWGLDGAPAGWIEIGARGNSHPRRPGTMRMATVRTADLCRIGGLPVTRVPRTLVDMAAVVEPDIVERGMECALRRRLVTINDLHAAATATRLPGGRRLLRVIEGRPAGMPPTESDAETIFAQLARSLGLPEPARQVVVSAGRRRYRLDFAWPALRLAVEIDGTAVHGPDQLKADLRRQNQIVLDGWLLLRFTWHDLVSNPAAVERDLRNAWRARTVIAGW